MSWVEFKALAAFGAMLALILVPAYLVMRALLGLARIRYGFAPEPPDDGKPLRVCDACGNSVLEAGYRHCPYCGGPLPDLRPPAAAEPLPAAPAVAPADAGSDPNPSL